jgi:hypothetical protein
MEIFKKKLEEGALENTTKKDGPVSSEEQNQLLKVFVNPVKQFFSKVSVKGWQVIHTPIRINWLSLISIVTIVSAIIIVIMVLTRSSGTQGDFIQDKKFSITSRVEDLKQSHNYFTKVASKNEKLVKWILMFHDFRWENNGDPKYKRIDCVGSTYWYFQKWNSNFNLETLDEFVKRAKNLSDRGELEIRRSPSSVQSGDIIVIQVDGQLKHMGVVFDVKNNQVQYMDVNAITMGMGLERKPWGDGNIQGIYEMSFPLWCGNLMRELNTLK